ncbi:cytochrome C family protein [Rhodanobacter fulvus Jip2]|uniref:Cytochrome C family protein n=1 Tax=Rhodanobacter fulvus Jip2 TaxID=1163408 RepID=I4VQ96_9GAMM|nr:DmsE family decaheme c-type cytochrome [Rhodanobacter fulvus]EIL89387.1 cytochrome C family protein [Rhodanobacter fulvus Jip2]
MRVISPFLAVVACLMLGTGGLLLMSYGAQAQQAAPAPSGSVPADHVFSHQLSQSDIARMLPATDMGANSTRPHNPHSAAMGDSTATPFDAASIPANPLAPNADPVGAKTCVACHAQENVQASHSLHVASFRAGAANSGPQAACESCHGPGSEHAKDPTAPGKIIAFTHDAKTSPQVQAGVCLSCHAGGARQHWIGSIHQTRDLSCTDCHNPMAKLSPEGVLAKSSINEVCSTCHQDIRAKFNRRSHMPLPEGQMACTDCHNPHGSITKPLLKTDTVNETCYTCHAEKRGPFLFEHAPVRANCLNCHDVHGSNQQTLLVAPIPMLCQQCHTMTRHPNDLQTRAGMGTGPSPDERLMGRGCLSCHTNIHGSNNPSGPKFHK